MSKRTRQNTLLELVQQQPYRNQDELRRALARRGFDVTQATLSRDIHELGLVKTSDGYAVQEGEQPADAALPPAFRLVREFVLDIKEAQNLLVVRTAPGSAQPVAAALDAEGWSEMVGTVAGDDTLLIISQNRRSAQKMAARIRGMLV
jgi:transcriptional regulator of arginine metabolism